MKQEHSSAGTSVNQIASIFRSTDWTGVSKNLDYGGGRFDTASDFLAEKGVRNMVFDPFNRSEMHNLSVRREVMLDGGVASVTVANVLNVIKEDEVLDSVIRQASSALSEDGAASFLIYEGDSSGIGRATSKGWQRNEKPSAYVERVGKFFGEVSRKGNLIRASKPLVSLDEGLFSEKSVSSSVDELAKKNGLPRRDSCGVGKRVGTCLYVHRSAVDVLPQDGLEDSLKRLPEGFEWDVVKFDKATGEFSFIESPDFDESEEPLVGRAVKVKSDGSLHETKRKQDPQIYHHKWNFVRESYEGFDTISSLSRSVSWAETGCDRSRIGTLSFWEREVLLKHGLPLGREGDEASRLLAVAVSTDFRRESPRSPC